MSRAFVREQDGDVADELPDRPISEHRNFVTISGLAQINDTVARFREALRMALAAADKPAVATAARDLRYWSARQASAELVEPPMGDEVRFGSTVTIERGDGRRQTFRITGEDEAEPTRGTLSYLSPLARALIGKVKGDEFAFMDDEILVVEMRA